MHDTMRIFGTIFAALLGLAFGSFLNVCLSRWPEGESVVRPRSHCRSCGRALTWWENIPLISWVALRGRCRTCGAWIGIRYPVVELAIGIIAIYLWLECIEPLLINPELLNGILWPAIQVTTLCVILLALAVLDAEHFWLPDAITLPGIALGIALGPLIELRHSGDSIWHTVLRRLLAAAIGAAIILVIRWIYWLVRKQEGLGLGDAKLMAMLGAWLGLPGMLLAFFIGVVFGAIFAVGILAIPRLKNETWSTRRLPLGTFLCIGGIISALWGPQMIDAYMRWANF